MRPVECEHVLCRCHRVRVSHQARRPHFVRTRECELRRQNLIASEVGVRRVRATEREVGDGDEGDCAVRARRRGG